MSSAKAAFLQNAPVSYDPKQYTRFLETQIDSFGQLQTSVETMQRELGQFRILYNQQEQRIAAQARLIQLMQQVIEKQQREQGQQFLVCKQQLQNEVIGQLPERLAALQDRLTMLEAGHSVLQRQLAVKAFEVPQSHEAVKCGVNLADNCNFGQIGQQPYASGVDPILTNSARTNADQEQQMMNSASCTTKPWVWAHLPEANDYQSAEMYMQSQIPAYNCVSLPQTQQQPIKPEAQPQIVPPELNMAELRTQIVGEIKQSLPQIIASQLSQSLPVIQDNFNEKALEIQKNIASQLSGLIDGLYDRIKAQSSSVSSTDYRQQLQAFDDAKNQANSQRDQMKRILERKFDAESPDAPSGRKKTSKQVKFAGSKK